MWYLRWVSFKLQVHYNKDHYVIAKSLLSNTCDLFARTFEVFNEMEMEIKIINNKIFTKNIFKKRARGKEIS